MHLSFRTVPTLVLVLGLIASNARAGARLIFDSERGTARVENTLVLFGKAGEPVSADLAARIADQIERQWSGLATRPDDPRENPLWINTPGHSYRVRTEVRLVTDLSLEQARAEFYANKDVTRTYVRVVADRGTACGMSRSLVAGNAMVLYASDVANWTSAAHEFGHILGLSDEVGARPGVPDIMVPRGMASGDPEYHYDPSDPIHSPTNPIFRRVAQWDVLELEWNQARPASGSGTTVYGANSSGNKLAKQLFSRRDCP